MVDAGLHRHDLRIIASWIRPGARVLDLGCGCGELLAFLAESKQVRGAGIERSEEKVAAAIARGIPVLQGDILKEIEDYPDLFFDYVIVSQTLQQVYEPARLIKASLRVGRAVVVSFPNFSHWRNRLQLLLHGRAPVSPQLPYDWHDTPNIRVITIRDFRRFTKVFGLRIRKQAAINPPDQERPGRRVHFLPNLRATYGIFLIEEDRPGSGHDTSPSPSAGSDASLPEQKPEPPNAISQSSGGETG